MKRSRATLLTVFLCLFMLVFWLMLTVNGANFVQADSARLQSVDSLADETRELVFVGEIGQGIWHAWDVAVNGNYAFVADDSAGLRVVDISDPEQPSEITSLGPFNGLGVAASGSQVYVVGSGKLRTVDISNLPTLSETSSITITFPTSVAIHDSLLFVASADGIHIMDISIPTIPDEIGFLEAPGGQLYEVFAADNYAYLAEGGPFDDFEGIRIVDVTDPTKPVLVGSSPDLNGTICESVAVSGNHAFATTWDGGVHVLDISQPSVPTLVGGINPAGTDRGIATSDQLQMAFVAANPIAAIDIGVPTTPLAIDSYETPGAGRDLAVKGTYVYVANYLGALSILQYIQSSSSSIPVTGGQLVSAFDSTSYIFPAGIFTDTVVVTHTMLLEDDVPSLGILMSGNHFFNLNGTRLATGQPAQPVSGEVFTITIVYDDSNLIPEQEVNLALYWWDDVEGFWSREGITSTVDIEENQITVAASHLSVFGLLIESTTLQFQTYIPFANK